MLCKNCRTSHTENNKIGFAFFGFFYDFIWILQVAAKTHQRGKILFTKKPLESFKRFFLPNSLELLGALQCSPWGLGAARPGEIPATSPASSAGEWLGRL
jgi:hypothetical protein